MPITPLPQLYRTSDGSQFTDPVEAEKHEALVTAKKQLEDALEALKFAAAESVRTADGEFFQFWGAREYYYVANNYPSLPYLEELRFYPYQMEFSEHGNKLRIKATHTETAKEHWYNISQLYAHKSSAAKALIALRRERLEEYWLKTDDLAKQLGVAEVAGG